MVSVLASILVRVGAKRATRLLVAGQGISSVGTGVVVPLTLIYLHQVRGIPLAVTGALFAAAAVMGLVTVPLAGVLLDRAGGTCTVRLSPSAPNDAWLDVRGSA